MACCYYHCIVCTTVQWNARSSIADTFGIRNMYIYTFFAQNGRYYDLPKYWSFILGHPVYIHTYIYVYLFIYQSSHLLSIDMPALMKAFVTLNLTSMPPLLFIGKIFQNLIAPCFRVWGLCFLIISKGFVGLYKNHFTKLLWQFNA
jgi:hypothetical protein